MNNYKKGALAFIYALLLVGIDQFIKWLTIVLLSENMLTFPVIQDVLHFTYLENTGAAFSMLDGKRFLLIGVTSVVLLAASVAMLAGKLRSGLLRWSVATVIGGGIGNLIDRIFRGYVIDYIDVRLVNFAVFNFADCCVVIGTVLLVCYLLFGHGERKKDEKGTPQDAGL